MTNEQKLPANQMKLPKYAREIVLARDLYRTKLLLIGNEDGSCDLQTDTRMVLSAALAREISTKLLEFAVLEEKRLQRKQK